MQADITYSDAIVTDWSDELSCLLGQIMPVIFSIIFIPLRTKKQTKVLNLELKQINAAI